MNKKKLLYVLALSVLPLSACQSKGSDSPSAAPSEDTASPSEDRAGHQDPYVKTLPSGAATRNFKDGVDAMVEDFSVGTLAGELTGGAEAENHLRVLVDSANEDFPDTPDAAIYKMATGSYALENYDGIGFRIRKKGEGTLDLSNLVLGLRGDDKYNVFNINLGDAVDTDGDALPQLTNQYQDIIISPNQSIEDDTIEYDFNEKNGGGKSGVRVLDKILGFHLFAQGDCSQEIEIENVFITNAGDKTILDDFNRQAVDRVDNTVWWRDSTGFIINQGVELFDGASYKTTEIDNISDFENLVVRVNGNSTGAKIGFDNSALFNWSNLKDPEGNSVVNAVNGAYGSFIINFEQSGIDPTGAKNIIVSSDSDLFVSQIFLSNLEDEAAITSYPALDTENAVVFDSFSRTQAHIASTYEAGNEDADEQIKDADLYYSVSYNNADLTSVDGDCLVINGSEDYVQVTEGSKHGNTGQEYMVLVMKLEDGATLDNFRIKDGVNDAIYANNWLAGPGLYTIPRVADYPYALEDGFTWYVIDLERTGFTVTDSLDMYYTGEGKLMIDSIFFANSYGTPFEATINGEENTVYANGVYQYSYGGYNEGSDTYFITLSGDGTATLETFRLQYNGATIWANNGLVIRDEDGEAVDITKPIPTTPTKYTIDLDESGFEIGADHIHLHFADNGGESTGEITISNRSVLKRQRFAKTLLEPEEAEAIAMNGVYQYHYGGFNPGAGEVEIVLSGDGTATLETFRLQYNGDTIFANDSLCIFDENGTAVDITAPVPTTPTSYFVDLELSGFEIGADHMHLHFSYDDGLDRGTLNFVKAVAHAVVAPYSEVIDAYHEN